MARARARSATAAMCATEGTAPPAALCEVSRAIIAVRSGPAEGRERVLQTVEVHRPVDAGNAEQEGAGEGRRPPAR